MSKRLSCSCNGFGEPASKKLPFSRQGKNERKERAVISSFSFPPSSFLISFSLLSSHFLFPSSERRERVSLLPLIFASLSETSASREARNLITHYLKISRLQFGADPSINCKLIVLDVEMIPFPCSQPLLCI